MFNGIHAALYREITVYRKRAGRQLLASSVSPLLFLVAFGWGFGRDVSVGGLSYMQFLIPGLIAMNALNQSYGIAQEINIARFYLHVFDQFLVAPVTPAQIVLGEAMYGVIKALIATLVIFIYALLFGVPLSPTPAFALALLLHAFCFSFFGVFAAMAVRDHSQQNNINTFLITPMVFFCGTFFPVDKLPPAFNYLVAAFPLTYSTKLIRATLTGGAVNWFHMGLLAAFTVIAYLLALEAVKRVED